MNRWYPFSQLFVARMREFYREPEVLFWVYGFPLLLAIGLGVAFSGRKPDPPEVDVQNGPDETLSRALYEELARDDGVKVSLHSPDECATG